jgi:adenylate cyclase
LATDAEPDSDSVDRPLSNTPAELTAADVASAIGRDEDYVRRVWRLFGFADPERAAVFLPADVELLRVQSDGTDLFGAEYVEHMTRAVGAGTRNIIEATIALFPAAFGALESLPPQEAERLAAAAFALLDRLIHALPALLVHQSEQALSFLAAGGVEQSLAVGFCDLIGSTTLANTDAIATARAVAEFETQAADAVAQRGGRLVKFVGDEVMFATSTPADARAIAFDVLRCAAEHEYLSLARAGIAYGPVVSHNGDLYGPTVNLAARLVAMADPDSLVMADDAGENSVTVKGFEGAIRVSISRRN